MTLRKALLSRMKAIIPAPAICALPPVRRRGAYMEFRARPHAGARRTGRAASHGNRFPFVFASTARLRTISRLSGMLFAGSRKRRQAGPHGNVCRLLRAACLRLFFCAAAFALIFAGPVAAQDQPRPELPDEGRFPPEEGKGTEGRGNVPELASRNRGPGPAATRIEVDQEAAVIRFFIDGEEKARLDADGLHADGDITYRGFLKIHEDGGTGLPPPATP